MLVSQQINFVKKQRGFTLMEVMVASFVLAVGMLGSTAMVMRGHQEAKDTNYEAVAMQLASNMAERMRSNVKGVEEDGVYNSIDTAAAAFIDCSGAGGCSPADIADYHNYVWSIEMEELMPNANATGTVTALAPFVNDSVYAIEVVWDRVRRIDKDESEFVVSSDDDYKVIFQP